MTSVAETPGGTGLVAAIPVQVLFEVLTSGKSCKGSITMDLILAEEA